MNKKFFKLISILALMFPLLVSMVSATAYASTTDDEIKTVNVHLNKLVVEKGTKPDINNTGQEMTGLGGESLPGVTFKVFDVTNTYVSALTAGKTAEDATAEIVKEASKSLASFGAELKEEITNNEGVATFSNLPVKNGDNYATYLFVETKSPAEITERATPIVLSMPVYIPNTNDINTDVVVYPKNEKDTMITKDLSSEAKAQLEVDINGQVFNAEIGKPFGYSISTLIPWNISDKEYYRVTDTPDAGMKVLVDTVQVNGLVKDTDYTVTPQGEGYVLELILSSEKVKNLAGQRIEIKYDAILTEGVTIDLGINNTAKIELGTTTNPDTPDKPIVTGPEVFTGGKKFKKVDDRSGKTLAGAEFQLVKVNVKNEIVAYGHYENGKYTWNQTESAAQYISDTNGLFEVKGLEYSAKLTNGESYALVEVKAPNGYAVLNKPIKFDIVKGEFDTVTLAVENIKKGILPSTGGNGIYMFLAAGSLLMIGAFIWYRRTQVEAEV